MFERIYDILNRAKRLDDTKIFRMSVDGDIKRLIIRLNTDVQLGEYGIDSDERSLGEYAAFTIESRSELGLQTEHIDFKVTGNYWNSWRVELIGDELHIFVDEERYDELVDDLRFSAKHVGLTPENLNIVSGRLLDNYRKNTLNEILGL